MNHVSLEEFVRLTNILKEPRMLVRNGSVPLGQLSFHCAGPTGQDITIVLPMNPNPVDLTHFAPICNLLHSPSLKALIDRKWVFILNPEELEDIECGNGGEGPGPEPDKDQKPLTAADVYADATTVVGTSEPEAIISMGAVYTIADSSGAWTMPVSGLTAGTQNLKAVKKGYKDQTGTLEVKALQDNPEPTVAQFNAREEMKGSVLPNAKVTLTHTGNKRTITVTASGTGTFIAPTADLYVEDDNSPITVVSSLPTYKDATHTITAQRIAAQPVSLLTDLIYGDKVVMLEIEPHIGVKLNDQTAVADSKGNVAFDMVDPIKDKLAISVGSEATSIFIAETNEETPNKRQTFLTQLMAKDTDTSLTIRHFGTVLGLPAAKVIVEVSDVEHEAVFDSSGTAIIDGLTLAGVTEFSAKIESDVYYAQPLDGVVFPADSTPPPEDQAPIVVTQSLFKDTDQVTGTAEPDSLLMANGVGTQVGSDGTFTLKGLTLSSNNLKVTTYKQGYNDQSVTLPVADLLTLPATMTVAPFKVRETANVTGYKPNIPVTARNAQGGPSVDFQTGQDGSGSVNTSTLFAEGFGREIVFSVSLSTYVPATYPKTALPITSPRLVISPEPRFNDTAISVLSEPYANLSLKIGDAPAIEARCGTLGSIVIELPQPLRKLGSVEIVASPEGFYEQATYSVDPQKEALYLSPSTVRESATEISVSVFGLIEGFTTDLEVALAVEGVPAVTKAYEGTDVKFDVDLTGKAFFELNIVQNSAEAPYSHATQRFEIVKDA